jgi:hypothetical protein
MPQCGNGAGVTRQNHEAGHGPATSGRLGRIFEEDAMARHRAVFTVRAGPNEGDTVSVEQGSCRLIGRHLSENETTLIDRHGNRLLDAPSVDILTKHLKGRAPDVGTMPPKNNAAAKLSANTFERGADIILADDSISRAHAMVFFDETSVGIIDLASTNGTFVNNERVSSAIVSEGDVITIGNSDVEIKIK